MSANVENSQKAKNICHMTQLHAQLLHICPKNTFYSTDTGLAMSTAALFIIIIIMETT